MRKSIILAALLVSATCFASDGDYAVSKINASLMKNADAVLRYENITFEIQSVKEAVETNHYVITVLNENGDKWAELSEYYDKLREISGIEGILYDADGKQIKKIKTKDCQDLSASDGENLFDDHRMKLHNFYYKSYPYTIEYTVEIHYKNTLFFPMWSPQGSEKLSVEHSEANIICPQDYQFRYKAFRYTGQPVSKVEKNKKITTWSAQNMPAIVKPPYAPLWHELTTVVIFGPSEFQLENYKGNMNSWQDFGKFVYSLKQGRDALPDNVKQAIHQIADNISDPKEKVKALYEFMQKNTRYVSVQLGIGGWQPFDASFVAQKGYGDCKALSNYMYSILKEAGIKSCYTVVRAGESANYITEDFPSQQFNHAILCVPMAKDTMWLECTNQTIPAGYMGAFTGNRKALVVDENGGTLVSTPRYGLKENVQVRSIKGKIDEEGNLSMKTETNFEGTEQDDLSMMVNSLSKDKVQKILQEELELSTYNINDFKYKETKAMLPQLDEQLDITVNSYATASGRRLFIVPNILSRSSGKFATDEERKVDLVFDDEWRHEDNAEIEIPAGYQLEAAPETVNIKTEFGSYSSSAKVDGNKIIYHRVREQFSGRFPAKDQGDLTKFFSDIYKADRAKIVLVKKEA